MTDGPWVIPTCTGCHNGVIAPDNFVTWRNTGHAEAFTQGITTNSHFGESCFACHAVGYDRDNAGGIDDTPNYENFLTSLENLQSTGMIADAWTMMLEDYPDTARKSNIQCENCHGPQDYTDSHPYDSDSSVDSRVKLGSEVCGSCHGEPARHGRYQQWLLSNHADYELAAFDAGLPTATADVAIQATASSPGASWTSIPRRGHRDLGRRYGCAADLRGLPQSA